MFSRHSNLYTFVSLSYVAYNSRNLGIRNNFVEAKLFSLKCRYLIYSFSECGKT